MRFTMPLDERMHRAELKRARYRADPERRLKAINKERMRSGRPLLASLDESRKLRLPLEAR